jgi:hypothetical protein
MRRLLCATLVSLAWLLFAVPPASAELTISVGIVPLLPNTADQVIPIVVHGGDAVDGVTFNVRIGDGLTPGAAGAPSIADLDILGTAAQPTIFFANNTGQVDPDGPNDPYPYYESRSTTTAGGTVSAEGLLARVTVSTLGVDSGRWDLVLKDPAGFPTEFPGVNVTIQDGSIEIVPEPGSWVGLAGLLLGAPVWLLRRRDRGAA